MQLPIGIELERRDGWIIVKAAIPPRVCGLPNEACSARVQHLIRGVNPAGFDPVTPQVAEAAERDAFKGPPNCEGCIEGLTPNATTLAAIAESYARDDLRDPEQDDDEGDPAEPARYPPGVACNVTGECE